MKRTFKYALSAILGAMVVMPALAQENFPDVPENHWAYKELALLKRDGILVGYPDGLFRGARPASRYELAVAIHATYTNLKGITDGLKSQIDDIMSKLGNMPSKADIDNLRSALDALQNEVNRIKSEDIAALRRLIEEFGPELKRQGADIAQMKADLADLGRRVTDLEKHRLPFDVSGTVDAVVLGGYSRNGNNGITVDARPTGVGRGSYGGTTIDAAAKVGAERDLTVLHSATLSATSNNPTGPKWHVAAIMSNMLGDGREGTPFFTESRVATGRNFAEGLADIWLQEANVTFDTSLLGLGFNAQVGRVGYKISPWLFQRPDTTPYYANDAWDNGNWYFDGGIIGFNVGNNVKLTTFLGRTSQNSVLSVNGTAFNAMFAGNVQSPLIAGERPRGFADNPLPVDQMWGINADIPLTKNGNLGLTYLMLGSNTTTIAGVGGNYNRVDVWGADAKFNFAGLNVFGGASKSEIKYNQHTGIKHDTSASHIGVGYEGNKFGAKAEYRTIDPNYGAPGDWGRIGIWWNPTGIKGFNADAHFDLTPDLRLQAMAGSYTRRGDAGTSYLDTLGTNTRVTQFQVGFAYRLASSYDLALGYEQDMWDARTAGTSSPIERWYNIGFGLNLSESTKLKFLWQISDYDSKGVAGFGPFAGSTQTLARGGLITTQLSVKF